MTANLLTSDEPEGTELEVRERHTGETETAVVTDGGIVRKPNALGKHRPAYSAGAYEIVGVAET